LDTPEQARIKSKFMAALRAERGDAWLEEFAGLLEYQWLFLKESHFLD